MTWKTVTGVMVLLALLGGMKYLFDQAEKKPPPK